MNGDKHFIELWNDYLEGELDESGLAELQSLVQGDDRLLRMAADSYQIHRLLGFNAQNSAPQQDKFTTETMARLPLDDGQFVDGVMQHLVPESPDQVTRARIRRIKPLMAIAAVIALVVSMIVHWPSAEQQIATITGLSGSVQWTGEAGQVTNGLQLGMRLSGGTIEGMTPRSWLELEFDDRSTLTISGTSRLTYSDQGQKRLHLSEGSVSSSVTPQPLGKPMLVYTRSALLEVLGTQFEVETGLSDTRLTVNKGKVRMKRLSDGHAVDVLAQHRAIAGDDRDMLPTSIPDAVNRWQSELHLGPDGANGKWSPGTDSQDATLGAIAFNTPEGTVIHTATFCTIFHDKAPVVLKPDSRFKIRGRVALSNPVYFGVTVRNTDGGFGGRFQIVLPAAAFPSGEDFELDLQLRDFRLDPGLIEMKSRLASNPFNFVVESFWCHTLDKQAGLAVMEAELITPPAMSDSNMKASKDLSMLR